MNAVITAGLDGSQESLAAARWAAREAQVRSLPLRLLHARAPFTPVPETRGTEEDWQAWSKHIVEEGLSIIQEAFPDLKVTGDLVPTEPRGALLEAAEQSTMLVLGSQGLAPVSYFLGDIGLNVVARAESPVVLVHDGEGDRSGEGEREQQVVAGVGLDSERAAPTLEFAYDFARRHEAGLLVVQARRLPAHVYTPWGADHVVVEQAVRDMRQELARSLRPWHERFPSVRTEAELRAESPARAVLHAGEGAALLVLGRRRHPGVLRPRIGPVVQAAVHHAPCPVAVVPHD